MFNSKTETMRIINLFIGNNPMDENISNRGGIG